ncbi:substrate-binding domain-containing protein [Frankia sp. CcWB3]
MMLSITYLLLHYVPIMRTRPTCLRKAPASAAALAVLAALAACSTSSGSDSSSETASGGSAVATVTPAANAPEAGSAEGKKFIYVAYNAPLYGGVYCGAKAEAERLGASITRQYAAEFTPASQIPVLNAALATSPDGLVISPTDPNAMYEPIKSVVDKGIPVATAINNLTNTDQLTAQSLVNNEQSGAIAAKYLAEKANGKKVKVGLMTFTAGGSAAADGERHGFESEIKKYDNITYVGAQFDAGGVADTTKTAAAMLARHPDLFGVFGTETQATTGIVTAAKESK